MRNAGPSTAHHTCSKGSGRGHHLTARGMMGIRDSGLAILGICVPPLQVHLVLTFGMSPPCMYFFLSLSAEENYSSAGIVHHGNKHLPVQL